MGKLRPYVSRCDEHAKKCDSGCPPNRGVVPAPPGLVHGRTTDACAQRFKDAERRPRKQEGISLEKSAATTESNTFAFKRC